MADRKSEKDQLSTRHDDVKSTVGAQMQSCEDGPVNKHMRELKKKKRKLISMSVYSPFPHDIFLFV